MCRLVVIIKQFREFKSFAEIRARLRLKPGTPSLKRPAKTFAPWVEVEVPGSTRGYAGGADETERLRTGIEVRRGVTVVGDLV
jgi:hypothetical protein